MFGLEFLLAKGESENEVFADGSLSEMSVYADGSIEQLDTVEAEDGSGENADGRENTQRNR